MSLQFTCLHNDHDVVNCLIELLRIPYNNTQIEHVANIRVLSNISDTSDISERIFSGQFHC